MTNRLRRLRTMYRTSVLTAYGRGLRRRIREPFDSNDYIEVDRPVEEADRG